MWAFFSPKKTPKPMQANYSYLHINIMFVYQTADF